MNDLDLLRVMESLNARERGFFGQRHLFHQPVSLSVLEIADADSAMRIVSTSDNDFQPTICPILRNYDERGIVTASMSGNHRGVACQFYDAGNCNANGNVCGLYRGSPPKNDFDFLDF